MRLPNTAHTSRPWRIHEFTPDFRLEDVWALPTPGGQADDFPRLVDQLASLRTSRRASGVTRALWFIRLRMGELFGWDDADAGLGSRVPTLRDRLPADLRDCPSGPNLGALPFSPLYLLDNEFAAEIANRTMHGVLHIGWVPDEAGGYRGQMAILVKPTGLLGTAYMAAIRPFRHVIIYPEMTRQIERTWRERTGSRECRYDKASPPAAHYNRRVITGVHAIVYSPDAEKVRTFFADVLEMDSVDAGGGWPIFALPPAELAVHPADGSSHHELCLMCDDIHATLADLRSRGAEVARDVSEQRWGLLAAIRLPDGAELAVYEPRHPSPLQP